MPRLRRYNLQMLSAYSLRAGRSIIDIYLLCSRHQQSTNRSKESNILEGLDLTLLCDSTTILIDSEETRLHAGVLFPPSIFGFLSSGYRDATVFDSE